MTILRNDDEIMTAYYYGKYTFNENDKFTVRIVVSDEEMTDEVLWNKMIEKAKTAYPNHYLEKIVAYNLTQEGEEEVYNEDDDWEEVDDVEMGFACNCHCDTYGVCGGISCRHYFSCHA